MYLVTLREILAFPLCVYSPSRRYIFPRYSRISLLAQLPELESVTNLEKRVWHYLTRESGKRNAYVSTLFSLEIYSKLSYLFFIVCIVTGNYLSCNDNSFPLLPLYIRLHVYYIIVFFALLVRALFSVYVTTYTFFLSFSFFSPTLYFH